MNTPFNQLFSKRWLSSKRLWVALFVTGLLASLVVRLPVGQWLASLPGLHTWLAGQGVWALPAFMGLYVLAAILGLPNIILILAAGTLFGLTEGVMSASIADTLSIAACFLIGQTVGRRWMIRHIRENSRFHKLDRAFAQKGWKIVFLTRLSPLLPSNVLNYGFSLTQINFWEYLFFSWLGMLPVIVSYVYIGSLGASLFSLDQTPESLFFKGVGLLATVGVFIYTTQLTTTALRTSTSPS